MAKNTKVIKKRITSVKNTRKITRSMQMIAAVKMQKAVKLSLQSKKYTLALRDLMQELAATGSIDHPLFELRPVASELLIIISANRGLCGNFNVNVLNAARGYLRGLEHPVKILALGKKAASFARKRDLELVSLFEQLGDKPEFTAVLPVAKTAVEGFLTGEFSKVSVVFTDYRSSFYQVPTVLPLLPLSKDTVLDRQVEEVEPDNEYSYKFEPDRRALLDYLLPRIIETQLYQAVLDSAASEHSSRMLAMKNATDSAAEIIQGLTLEFNKTRQAAITQEVAEIVGGVEALVA